MWYALVMLALSILQHPELIEQWISNARENGEMTPEKEAEYETAKTAAFASSRYKTDAEIAADDDTGRVPPPAV